jgi:hypothetical protein
MASITTMAAPATAGNILLELCFPSGCTEAPAPESSLLLLVVETDPSAEWMGVGDGAFVGGTLSEYAESGELNAVVDVEVWKLVCDCRNGGPAQDAEGKSGLNGMVSMIITIVSESSLVGKAVG